MRCDRRDRLCMATATVMVPDSASEEGAHWRCCLALGAKVPSLKRSADWRNAIGRKVIFLRETGPCDRPFSREEGRKETKKRGGADLSKQGRGGWSMGSRIRGWISCAP